MVEWEDISDLIYKIEYYLKNEEERLKIANHRYQEALTKHTGLKRTEYILKIFEKFL